MIIPTSRQTAWGNNGTFYDWTGAARGLRAGGKKSKRGDGGCFRGTLIWIRQQRWRPAPSPDVLFERGLYWASGRSGVVNLVAAHKWFNLAALKGHSEALPLRREVAEMMSEDEIAMAQREARAWMTAH